MDTKLPQQSLSNYADWIKSEVQKFEKRLEFYLKNPAELDYFLRTVLAKQKITVPVNFFTQGVEGISDMGSNCSISGHIDCESTPRKAEVIKKETNLLEISLNQLGGYSELRRILPVIFNHVRDGGKVFVLGLHVLSLKMMVSLILLEDYCPENQKYGGREQYFFWLAGEKERKDWQLGLSSDPKERDQCSIKKEIDALIGQHEGKMQELEKIAPESLSAAQQKEKDSVEASLESELRMVRARDLTRLVKETSDQLVILKRKLSDQNKKIKKIEYEIVDLNEEHERLHKKLASKRVQGANTSQPPPIMVASDEKKAATATRCVEFDCGYSTEYDLLQVLGEKDRKKDQLSLEIKNLESNIATEGKKLSLLEILQKKQLAKDDFRKLRVLREKYLKESITKLIYLLVSNLSDFALSLAKKTIYLPGKLPIGKKVISRSITADDLQKNSQVLDVFNLLNSGLFSDVTVSTFKKMGFQFCVSNGDNVLEKFKEVIDQPLADSKANAMMNVKKWAEQTTILLNWGNICPQKILSTDTEYFDTEYFFTVTVETLMDYHRTHETSDFANFFGHNYHGREIIVETINYILKHNQPKVLANSGERKKIASVCETSLRSLITNPKVAITARLQHLTDMLLKTALACNEIPMTVGASDYTSNQGFLL